MLCMQAIVLVPGRTAASHCLFPTAASVRSLAALARQVLEVVAGHRGITHREQLAEQLYANAENMFFGQRTTAV